MSLCWSAVEGEALSDGRERLRARAVGGAAEALVHLIEGDGLPGRLRVALRAREHELPDDVVAVTVGALARIPDGRPWKVGGRLVKGRGRPRKAEEDRGRFESQRVYDGSLHSLVLQALGKPRSHQGVGGLSTSIILGRNLRKQGSP